MGCGHDPAGLRTNRDRRDVVSDRVVQLPRQLLALAETHLVQFARPGRRPVANRGADRNRGQQEHSAEDRVADPGELGGGAQDPGDHDDPQSDPDLPPGSPADQRIGQQHDGRHHVQTDGRYAGEHSQYGADDRDPEREGHCPQRVGASPQEADGDGNGQHQRDRSPGDIGAQEVFEDRRRQQHGEEGPVTPDPLGWLRRTRFGQKGSDRVCRHGLRVDSRDAARTGRKYGPPIGRTAEGTPALRPRWQPPGLATLRPRPPKEIRNETACPVQVGPVLRPSPTPGDRDLARPVRTRDHRGRRFRSETREHLRCAGTRLPAGDRPADVSRRGPGRTDRATGSDATRRTGDLVHRG